MSDVAKAGLLLDGPLGGGAGRRTGRRTDRPDWTEGWRGVAGGTTGRSVTTTRARRSTTDGRTPPRVSTPGPGQGRTRTGVASGTGAPPTTPGYCGSRTPTFPLGRSTTGYGGSARRGATTRRCPGRKWAWSRTCGPWPCACDSGTSTCRPGWTTTGAEGSPGTRR